MKKVSILFAVLAMSMAIACEKEDNTGENGKQKPVDPQGPWAVTVNAALANPQGRALSEQGTAITAAFATTENVYVYNGNTLLEGTLKPEADGTSTTLKGELTGEIASGDKLNLFYPKTEINYAGQDGTLAGMQNFNYAIAKDVEVRIVKSNNVSTADASFEVLQSFAKFTFNVPVKTLTISAEGLVQSIAGNGTETNGDVTVTLASPSKVVYVALRNTGAAATDYTFAATDANDIAWAGVKSLKVASGDAGEISLELNQAERYVTVDGAGEKNGSNWANAFGTAELKAAIGKAKDGMKFYLAAGKYVLTDADSTYLHIAYADTTTVSFFGGYTESGAEGTEPTVFSGDKTYQIFYVTGPSTLNFKNVTFADAKAIQDAELVKNMRGAISVNDDAVAVHLENCVFKDNVETGNKDASIGSGQEGGAALYAKAGAIYANKCVFTGNNSGSRGGVIRTENNSRLFMNECVFDGNGINREAYGRVAFTKSNFCLNKCVFHASFATANETGTSFKNDPTLNLNFNNIIVNCRLIEEAKYNGTGVVRNETVGSDGYKCMIMNNTFMNTYTDNTKTKIATILLTKAGMTSSGYNLLVGQNQIIVGNGINVSSLELKDTDDNLTALANGVSYLWNATTMSYTWTGLTHTFANSATVEAEVRKVVPTKNDTNLGNNFADWVKSVGGSF